MSPNQVTFQNIFICLILKPQVTATLCMYQPNLLEVACLSWPFCEIHCMIMKVRLYTAPLMLSTPPHTSKSCMRLLRLGENGFKKQASKIPWYTKHFSLKRGGEESQIKRAQAGKSWSWGILWNHSQMLDLPLTGHFIPFSTFYLWVPKLLSKWRREES